MIKDELVEVLKEISSRLQGVEDIQRNIQGIMVEQGTQISDIRTHQLEDSNRIGEQVHRHEGAIIEINARLAKLDGQAPKARTVRAGNGSTRR